MGIPRFYRWLKQRYPLIRMDLADPDKNVPDFDNLYIDFNAIIYHCIRQSECFLKNKVKPLTIDQIYHKVVDYLLEVVRAVNPQKILFIAFDGVAPRAKINQSRDRRFRSGVEDIELFEKIVNSVGIKTKENFEPNSISPGTEFLFNLCVFLKKKVMDLMEKQWRGLQVFYSDCCVPGQGQHKIMDFLRYSKQIQLFNANTTHCIYSPDADVILLSLSLELNYIALIKEDTSQQQSMNWTATSTNRKTRRPQFELVFINILRQYLSTEFEEELKAVQGSTIQNIIDDFVLLMAFIGNDFLPVEFCFKLSDSHMNALFDHYRGYLHEHKQFINKKGAIDWGKITELLKVARKFQAQRISQLKTQYRSRKQQHQEEGTVFDQEKPEDVDNSEIEKFEIEDDKIIKGSDQYYKSRFDINEREKSIKFVAIIKKYIEGLEFYCQYYYRGLPSWTWYYPFHYTPLLSDVYQYLTKKPVEVKLPQGEAYDPIMALVFMLPPQNFSLLPNSLAAALSDPSCILKHPVDYYPRKFDLDKFQTLNYCKRALIEFLKQDEVRQVYEAVSKEGFSQKEKERNQRSRTVFFYPNGAHFTGMEISFEAKFKTELRKIIRPNFDGKQKNSQQCRFPSLSIYGQDFHMNEKGNFVSKHKYKYNGNPTELVFFNNFIGYVTKQEKVTPELSGSFHAEYQKKTGIIGSCDNYYVVKRGRYVRQASRHHVMSTRREVYVPDFALFKAPNYDYIPKTQAYENKQLYRIKQRVVVLSAQYFGCCGVIEELGDKNLKVRLTEDPIKCESRIEQIDQEFYSIKYVLKQLDISLDTFYTIISEVILLPVVKKKQFNERIPTSFNFGLNFIDIPNAKIVPRFVRCNFQKENTKIPQLMFQDIEVSKTGLNILQKYVQTFPWLIEQIEESRSSKIRKQFKASSIFGKEDPNIRLYKEFIKLYDFDSKGSFSSFYSKTSDLGNIPKMYTEKKASNAIVTMNYHEVISKRLGMRAPPPYKAEPEYHNIGARVILLRSLEVGYIVAIDDIWFEVVVGKEGQRVRAKFSELYNESWSISLATEPGKCWDGEVGFYTPTYWKGVLE